MPPLPPRRPRISPRTIAILGAIIAGTLLVAAMSSFGDPKLAAQAQATRSARASGELVRIAWQGMLRAESAPSSDPGGELRIENVELQPPWGVLCTKNPITATPVGHGSDAYTLFNVLLESADGAAARGDLAAAITTARDAVRLPPGDLRPAPRRVPLGDGRLGADEELPRLIRALSDPDKTIQDAARRGLESLDT